MSQLICLYSCCFNSVVYCNSLDAENDQWNIQSILTFRGCADCCATAVHDLQQEEITFFRNNFSARTLKQQNQWLLEYLNSNGSRVNVKVLFVVCGKKVCFSLWLAILGVSQTRYYRLRGAFLAGKVSLEKHTNLPKHSKESNEAIGWMENYFTRYMCSRNITLRLLSCTKTHTYFSNYN